MENQKTKIISIASIIALALTLVTATFAYFMAQTGEGKSTDIKINASTVDTFTFEAGSALNLSLNQENFASGKGNQTGTTFAKAMLSANNKTNTATDHYYMYLNISENTFTYTQDANTPEILLSIKDGSNNEIITLTGLTYKTVTDGKGASIKGFDITKKSGLITILNNREITTTSSKTEEWNVTVTFVNYNSNQAGNAGKNFSAKLMIQKEKIPTVLSDVCTSGNNLATCITTLSNKSEPSIVNIYHHTSSLANGAGDNSYRYAGASGSVNNYICLGSDEATCPDANLFRIIGVFGDKTKVIRAKSVGDKEWNTSADNTWSSSSLNTYLNGTYLTSLGTLAEKIATTTWKVRGGSSTYLYDAPKIAYQYEVGSSALTTTNDAKIGLMYVSDYGFAADSSGWTTKLSSYNSNNSKNWLYLGSNEWTISRNSGTASNAFDVFSGYVLNRNVIISYAVRPSFNLESSVKYVSGSGSMSDPVRVN
ncbi:unknown [Firmicutes bacterium CAG:460]|nr:unknown [Firmicutes bacterium CAG:460]